MINYDNILSDKSKMIQPSKIRKFFDIVSEIPEAISLGVGEPDFETPWSISDSAIKSLQKGFTHYTSNRGLLELREKISEYISNYNINYNPKTEIIVTIGASEAIDISLRALINPGDEILIPEPSYVSYSPCVTLCGGEPIAVNCIADNDFKLTPEQIKKAITPKTKAIIFPYPNNPTGAIMEKEYLEKIAPVIIENNLVVISDEIYAELTYGAEHVSIASIEGMRERTILINGFSKAFAMTGWRLGFVCAPKEFIDVMIKIHQYAIMCAPTVSQYGGLKALKDALCDNFQVVNEMKKEYDKRRRYMVKALNNVGLKCFEPKGAFYLFPCVKSLGIDGDEFAEKLLKEKKVAVVPGSAFGDCGKYFIRISYAYSMKDLSEAMEKIAEFVAETKLKNESQEAVCANLKEISDKAKLTDISINKITEKIKKH